MAVATGSIPVAPTIARPLVEEPASGASTSHLGLTSLSWSKCSLLLRIVSYQDGLGEKLVAVCETRSSGGVSALNLYVVPTADWLTRSP